MNKCRSSFLAQGLGLFTVSLGLAATTGCGKIKAMIGLDPSDAGVAMQANSESIPSLDSFEGEVGLMIKPGVKEREVKPIAPINLLVKAGKFRIDLPTDLEQLKAIGKVHIVVAALDKKLFAVLDDKKEVVLIELDKIGEHINRMKPPTMPNTPPSTPPKPPKITKTGHKDTLAGHTCEDWEIVGESGSKAMACIAERGVSWLKLPSIGMPSEHAWVAELLDGRHFPLRVVGYDKDGTEAGRIEVTKLEPKPMAAQLFEIPAGYRTVDLQQAIQGMMSAAIAGRGLPPGMPPGMPRGMPADLPPGVAAQLPPEIVARIKAAEARSAAVGAKKPGNPPH
jgi:hypothetical protein